MARGFSLTPQLDIQQIQMEAKSRWLRPSEICEILRNYQKLNLTPDPPYKPSGGSLYLFDRKALRYFRKDGHCWRKKKDGKTVREAHEKLKSGSVDVLHCYYAHGEENENFQRRSYWMLDGQLEHIVLVHYRDVSEGSRPSVPHLSNKDPGTVDKAHRTQTSSAVCSTHLGSAFASQACNVSSPSTVEWNEPTPSSEFEDADSGDDFGCSASLNHPYASGLTGTASLNGSFHNFFMNHGSQQNLMLNEDQQRICAASQPSDSSGEPRFGQHSTSTWDNIPSLNQKSNGAQECSISFEQQNPGDEITRMVDSLPDDYRVLHYGLAGGSNILTDAHAPSFRRDESTQLQVKEENSEILYRRFTDNCTEDDSVYTYKVPHEHEIYTTTHSKYNSGSQRKISSVSQPLLLETEGSCASKDALESDTHIDEPGELKKVDSFGKWMTKEIGKDCDDYLMASDSHNYWNALTSPSDVKDISSLSHHMQLNIHSPGPSLSQEQLFSIVDFSPDWAYSGIETKILITGTFLVHNEPNTIKWCCMFGEQEVSAEVLNTTAIRCQAPPHSPGRVPFYITCSNRLACSEVREFEYRENLSGGTFSLALNSEPEEVHLQVRFAKMLSLRADRKKLICSVENCLKCNLKKSFSPLLSGDGQDWDRIEKDSKNFRGYDVNHRNTLLEKLFRDMLYEWLVYKVHEEGKGPNVLDEEGQGVVHLAAALGYEWAIGPIAAAGVHPSFRDAHGRTALHWAAYFGREETVVTLVKLGAASGAVEDPTSKFPEGQTAADLASSRGHKGVAGYLAEAALTSHLSSLTFRETMVDGDLAILAAEEAVEAIKEQNIFSLDGNKGEERSLRGSLDAVRNSAQAAARIQFAYRVHSFRQRQLTTGSGENDDIDDNALVLSSLRPKVHRICHFNDSLHIAAVKIQQKFRGWRGRKDFLKIRDRIVKIQAHVRGYQVRKQYRKVVWSVSIVEKAILRWRRKRSGLRGFRSDKTGAARQEVDDIGEYEFLRLGRNQKVAAVKKALARVQSMVRYPEARDQYMRLVASSHKSKLAEEGKLSPQVQHLEEEEKKADGYLVASMMD